MHSYRILERREREEEEEEEEGKRTQKNKTWRIKRRGAAAMTGMAFCAVMKNFSFCWQWWLLNGDDVYQQRVSYMRDWIGRVSTESSSCWRSGPMLSHDGGRVCLFFFTWFSFFSSLCTYTNTYLNMKTFSFFGVLELLVCFFLSFFLFILPHDEENEFQIKKKFY